MKRDKYNNFPLTELPEMENSFETVLEMFTSTDTLRSWMQKPFIDGSMVMATDGHCLIYFNKKYVKEHPEPCKESRGVINIIPSEINQNLIINMDDLKNKLLSCQLEDDYDEFGEDKVCPECDGDGLVEWEYRSYTADFECPVCNGSGLIETVKKVANGKKRFEDSCKCKVGNSIFSVKKMCQLYNTAFILGQKTATMTHQTERNKQSVFQIGEVRLLIMPMLADDVDAIFEI